MPALRTWTDDQLTLAVKESLSWNQVGTRLGLKAGHRGYFLKHAERLGLDTSHFQGGFAHGRGGVSQTPLAELLVAGRKTNSAPLKQRLIEAGIMKNQCAVQACGQGPEWMGLPLVLQLDHIDGDTSNNLLENLQILCPNCHTQTETWGRRPAEPT